VGVVCVAGAAAGLVSIAARGGSVSCIPVTVSPHESSQRAIGEVLAPNGGKVYVRATGFRLFVGGGDPVRWGQERTFAPGRLRAVMRGHGRDIIFAGDDALYRSANGGRSWERLRCGHVVDGVAVAARRPSLIYLAADVLDGPPQGVGGGLYRHS
jgi:hypothetical protein